MNEPKAKILIVDDESEILKVLKKSLEDDYDIVTAARGREALELLDDSFAVVLSDQRMPEMTGSELLKNVRERNADIVRIIMSGYSDMTALINSVNYGEIFRYIHKPWDLQALLDTIQLAVDRHKENVTRRYMADENKKLQDSNREISQKVHDLTSELQTAQAELAKLRGS